MSISEFITLNGPQLTSLGMPEILWKSVYQRIETNRLGSDGRLVSEDGLVIAAVRVGASEASEASEAGVFVYAHEWLFESRDQAQRHLDESAALKSVVADLVRRTTQATIQIQPESNAILPLLFRIAFEFEVRSAEEAKKLYAVSMDKVAPCMIKFDQNPLLGAGIFIDIRTNKSYTLLWPLRPDEVIEKGTQITRGELICMPDYSTAEYWKYHYATSKQDTTFDWFLPWSKGFSALLKSIVPAPTSSTFTTVLNVGCGNSTSVGDGLVADGVCDLAIHFDVSSEAVKTISRLSHSTKGLQEFAVFDGALSSGFPFRTSDTNGKLFEWAFDKGTTDGLLRSDMDIVRQLWKNLATVTDTLVWVSLGRPELRVILIEDEIGCGWEVDQCLQIDGSGSIKTHWVYVCKQKK